MNGATEPPSDRSRGSGLLVRALSAIVLAPAALAVVWQGGHLFSGFVAVSALIVGWEWARLCSTNTRANRGIALGTFIAGAVLLAACGLFSLALWILAFGTLVVAAISRYCPFSASDCNEDAERPSSWKNGLWVAAGTAYIGVPCVALVWLRNGVPAGDLQLLWLLLVVWVTDIGAFAVGKTLGGPKLAPRISPGKTWAGLIGAVLLSIGFGVVSAFHDPAWESAWLALLAMGLSLLAQAGDLGESAAKRRFGVKDSGRLIPGHGGVLDRVDGLLAASTGYAAVCLANGGSALTWQ